MNWIELDRKHVWHPFTQEKTAKPALHIVKAKDASLFLSDGRSLIDCNSSWWVNIHGHGNLTLKEAILTQFDKIDHVIFAGATHDAAIELSKKISDVLPEALQKVFFSDNGSTSVEVALKMAIQFWFNQKSDRKKIMAMDGAYHGDTFGAMSAGQRGYFNKPFEDYFFDVDFIPFPDGNEEAVLNLASEQLNSKKFAALIVEPLVQGSSGMRMYSSQFLDRLVAIAKSTDTLVIFDEVMTGWGRTGKMFALDHCQEVPDIVCLSKGLTGGVLPLGLTVATERIYQAFYSDEKTKALLHGHSFTGNPISCAVAKASIDLLQSENTLKSIEHLSASNKAFKIKLQETFPSLKVRTLGTLLAIEIETKDEGYFASIRDEAYDFFIDHGLLIRPLGNVLFINPPYCITDVEIGLIQKVILKYLNLTLKS